MRLLKAAMLTDFTVFTEKVSHMPGTSYCNPSTAYRVGVGGRQYLRDQV